MENLQDYHIANGMVVGLLSCPYLNRTISRSFSRILKELQGTLYVRMEKFHGKVIAVQLELCTVIYLRSLLERSETTEKLSGIIIIKYFLVSSIC